MRLDGTRRDDSGNTTLARERGSRAEDTIHVAEIEPRWGKGMDRLAGDDEAVRG